MFLIPGGKEWGSWINIPTWEDVLIVLKRYIHFSPSQVVKHPSKVVEVQMKKPGFSCEAGQVCTYM
jgi:hypothetical protein